MGSVMHKLPFQRVSRSSPLRALTQPRYVLAIICIIIFFNIPWPTNLWDRPAPLLTPDDLNIKAKPVVPCYGARGLPLSHSPDDELRTSSLSIPYAKPWSGSHVELGAPMTWMTADDRYGPYGFGENSSTYARSRVDWDTVDWGNLQQQCAASNSARFPKQRGRAPGKFSDDVRMSLRRDSSVRAVPKWGKDPTAPSTLRTVIVLRAYDSFEYKPENMWYIRSLITEAALQTGGEYTICLLVNVQNNDKKIFQSQAAYDKAFKEANIPQELQSIAVLWDEDLLEDWYLKVPEHRTMWQVMQPMQLFALHYPEFDHYWQIELDQRFLGDAGKYFTAMADFARREPRKQAFERSSFLYSEHRSGTYKEFMHAVDVANNGSTRIWGPMKIPDIEPIGPKPPVKNPRDDNFEWGVGEEADVIMTSWCADPQQNDEWVFRDWILNAEQGTETPRWWCPPAIMRTSRALLLASHESQYLRGLAVPSEATPPSFALWHGMKIALVPQPAYMHPDQSDEFKDELNFDPKLWKRPKDKPWFGWTPQSSRDGMGHAEPQRFADGGLTWWWWSNYNRGVMDIWLEGRDDEEVMPPMLAAKDGKVYIANLPMHPVKT